MSASLYYDELITKLQPQTLTDYEYGMPQQQQQEHQKPQEEQQIHVQTRKKRMYAFDK